MIALAISGSVFLNESYKGLAELLPGVPEDTVKSAIAGAGSELFASLDAATQTKAIDAIIKAMDKNYALVIAAGALTLVGSAFMPVSTVDL